MPIAPPEGSCRYCKHSNAYTKFTCDSCRRRLVWADAAASTSGEKCPQCERYNTYNKSNCEECESLLPWSECAAARYAARGNQENDQKSLAITIVVCLVFAFLLLWFVVFNVSPTK